MMRRRSQGEGRPHKGLRRLRDEAREEAAAELAPPAGDQGTTGQERPGADRGPGPDQEDKEVYKSMVNRLIDRARREPGAVERPDGERG